jgi:hypothetical protein
MAKSLDTAVADLDAAAKDVIDLIGENVAARAPDHKDHADLSALEIATNDLRTFIRNR